MMFFFFKQKTAYEVRISDWSSDVCSSDLLELRVIGVGIGSRNRDRKVADRLDQTIELHTLQNRVARVDDQTRTRIISRIGVAIEIGRYRVIALDTLVPTAITVNCEPIGHTLDLAIGIESRLNILDRLPRHVLWGGN